MLYRHVDRMPDLKFSLLGLGCWSLGCNSGWTNADDASSMRVIETAIDYGVTFFDTAPVYGFGSSEILLGKSIKNKRDNLIIASKCGLIWDNNNRIENNLTEGSVLKEIDSSLKRLNIDYIDIYQLHWPDPKVQIKDIQNTIEKLLNTQKIKYIGLSNFSLKDSEKLAENKMVVSYQGLYNVLEQNENSYHGISLDYKMQHEILPFCKSNGIAVFPYSPLMQGILTDTFNISDVSKSDIRMNNPKFKNIERYLNKTQKLKDYAKKLNITLLELVYGWFIHQKEITSIISGAVREEEILKNIKASEFFLEEEFYIEIEKIVNGFR